MYITGAVQGSGMRSEQIANPNSVNYSGSNFETMAPELWSRARVKPADVDSVQIYETFVPLVLMTLEDFGFCQRGEGKDFVQGRRPVWPDGELPLNTSGGNLAEVYIHGLKLINEAVRQMRGTSTAHVENAKLTLVAGGPGSHLLSAMLLRR